jgi:hypothetical protein|tara:strand:+ start:6251 stop:7045 length:795 start_codon:yes stop_codon:yes gene_type:complete
VESQSYSIEDVIAALNDVGYVDENVINYIVPIIAYESRVNGVPFTQDAKDPTSDSWGIYQTNINTEMAAIYKVMVDEGVDLPGMTDLQKKQLGTNIVGEDEKDVRKFTVNQKKVVREFLKNANLTTQTKIFKEMYEIKSGEIKSEKTEDVMEALYFNTTRKFYTDKQAEAVKFKATIDKDVSNYFKDKEEKMLNNEEIEKFKRMAANQNVKPETDPFARTKREMEFADKYKMPSDPELNSALTNVYSTLSEAKKRAIQSGVNIL